jgi:hypothetical protein
VGASVGDIRGTRRSGAFGAGKRHEAIFSCCEDGSKGAVRPRIHPFVDAAAVMVSLCAWGVWTRMNSSEGSMGVMSSHRFREPPRRRAVACAWTVDTIPRSCSWRLGKQTDRRPTRQNQGYR